MSEERIGENVGENESSESTLKRKTARDDILADPRKREYYERPSEKRKKKEGPRKKKY